jgi:hypothetical protein
MGKDRHAKKKREREALAAQGGGLGGEVDERVTCYYCEKEYANETTLINHQKNVHFKCEECHRKVSGITGLQIHCQTVHRTELERVPAAIEGRESIDVEVYGMAGVPRGFLDDMVKKRLRPDLWGQPPANTIAPFGTTVGAPSSTAMDLPSAFPIAQPGVAPGFAVSDIPGPLPPADGAFITGVRAKGKAKHSSAISIKLTTSKLDNDEVSDMARGEGDDVKEEKENDKEKEKERPSRWDIQGGQHDGGLDEVAHSTKSIVGTPTAALDERVEDGIRGGQSPASALNRPITLPVQHNTACEEGEEGEEGEEEANASND